MKKFLEIMLIIYLIFLVIINVNAYTFKEDILEDDISTLTYTIQDSIFDEDTKVLPNAVHTMYSKVAENNINIYNYKISNTLNLSIRSIERKLTTLDNEFVVGMSLFLSIIISSFSIIALFKY